MKFSIKLLSYSSSKMYGKPILSNSIGFQILVLLFIAGLTGRF